MGKFWNADIEAIADGQYQASPTSSTAWNATIAPGKTVSLGFVGKAADPLAPTNLELTVDDAMIATDAQADLIAT